MKCFGLYPDVIQGRDDKSLDQVWHEDDAGLNLRSMDVALAPCCGHGPCLPLETVDTLIHLVKA